MNSLFRPFGAKIWVQVGSKMVKKVVFIRDTLLPTQFFLKKFLNSHILLTCQGTVDKKLSNLLTDFVNIQPLPPGQMIRTLKWGRGGGTLFKNFV